MIAKEKFDAMFALVGIKKADLHTALRTMRGEYSRAGKDDPWNNEHPTKGYCAVVSGMVYSYLTSAKESVLVQMNLPVGGSHWFLGFSPISPIDSARYIHNEVTAKNGAKRTEVLVVDLTADQTEEDYDYKLGKIMPGIMSFWPQTGAQVLAFLLGFDYAKPQRHSMGTIQKWRPMDEKMEKYQNRRWRAE